MPDEIKQALKRLEGAEIRVVIRGGNICKIPAQEALLPLKDGIQIVYKIPADICDED